ncbi:6-phosphogluconolactonase [Isoptericola sp. S6320L]|uniref:6-phosphogluconolactonase n=1 Tax=Isoptericola sp. S6320L TaxID=2926411 RepID=UPI001FF1BABB|nr:6-phosphogluconolactonase [Isoptericola sp. S6320L]MCK0115758.1 6-phosphogluconolactonase [Isoptericola sp. S6320L]
MSTRLVVVHPDPTVLAEAAAARLLTRILDVQSVRSPVHVVLTGGTVGIKTLAAVAGSPLRAAVDWSVVHLWWGDERFLPAGDADRNETQARDALLDDLVASSGLPAGNIHAVPARGDGPGEAETAEDAATAYAAELAGFAAGDAATPSFDVLLLGMGPDGHVASLFPEHPALGAAGAVVPVHDSPKPPPDRVSLTFATIGHAREVWVVAAGSEKAAQAAAALADGPVTQVPAVRAVGHDRTLWLLDAAAAAGRD